MVLTIEIAGFLDVCPSSDILKNTTIRKPDLFPSSVKEIGDTYFVGSSD
jgi:hypothetical protein